MPGIPRVFRSAFVKYAYIFPFIQILLVPIQWSRTDQDRDSTAYYLASERIENGESMYVPHPPPGPHVSNEWYYLYPPFFASAIALAPSVSFATFARAWLLILLAGFWVFAACLARMVTGKASLKATLVAGAILHFVPGVYQAINMGQADILVWAMVGISLAYPSLRGAGFMAAALTKVLGAWPFAVGVWREGRKVVLGAAAVIVSAVAIAVLALGPTGFLLSSLEWLTSIVPVLGQGQFAPDNVAATLYLPFGLGTFPMPGLLPMNLSLSFAPIQWASSSGMWAPEPGNLPLGLRLYLTATSVTAPVLAGWLFRRQPVDLHCSLVLSAALLFSPILRITNIPILALPAVLYFSRRTREAAGGHSIQSVASPGTACHQPASDGLKQG